MFLGLLTYALLVAGMAAVRGEMFVLMLPLVVYLLAGYLFGPDEIRLEATRHLNAERAAPHSDVDITDACRRPPEGLADLGSRRVNQPLHHTIIFSIGMTRRLPLITRDPFCPHKVSCCDIVAS